MKILVIGKNGRGLAPTTPRKARLLLKEEKAIVIRKTPFTIRLLYKTGVASQQMTIGIDTGSQHIGIAVCDEKRSIVKAEYELRSTMEKRTLLETRREYRRGRRYRNTRFRKPKFKTKTKRCYSKNPIRRNGHLTHWIKIKQDFSFGRNNGWLPPSVDSKMRHHISIIKRYMNALPDNTALRIEIARFDVARMKDPNIHGELYQYGRMYDYENIKAYVFDRDGYKCRVCGAKAGSRRKNGTTVKLIAHHIDFRSKGSTDNPDRMASVCTECHTDKNHKLGGILYKWMLENKTYKRGYRDAAFMNILRIRLQKAFSKATFTYGNITSADRKAMFLSKTHANDALAIAARGNTIVDNEETVHYKQVRSKKRSLHEATPRKGRKTPNKAAKRNKKNTRRVSVKINETQKTFSIYDKVRIGNETGWITGFTGTAAYLKNAAGDYICVSSKGYKQVPLSAIKLISHNNNWLISAD